MIDVFPQYLTSPCILGPKYLNTHKEIALLTPLGNLTHSQHFEESSRRGPKAPATLGAFPSPRAGAGRGRASKRPCGALALAFVQGHFPLEESFAPAKRKRRWSMMSAG